MLSMLIVLGQLQRNLKQWGMPPAEADGSPSDGWIYRKPSAKKPSKGELMLTRENIESLLNKGGNVIGADGEKIGSAGQLYADDDTGEPTWATVKTGLFGTSQAFVPVEGARAEGDDLVVPYTKDHVKDAPRVETDGHLEPAEEDRLYAHYERGASTDSETHSTLTGMLMLTGTSAMPAKRI